MLTGLDEHEMSSEDSSGVTLALVDHSFLSSWEEMVKRGVECSLMLKHSAEPDTACRLLRDSTRCLLQCCAAVRTR